MRILNKNMILLAILSMIFILMNFSASSQNIYQLNSTNSTSIFESTFTINGNSELASYSSSGSGISTAPYILSDYNITCSSKSVDGITIQNTNLFFVLQNW